MYVHFPWCVRRCPYCDFTVTTRGPIPHAEYRDAVRAELAVRAARVQGPARSVYLGGGTPSLWDPACVGAVIEAVDQGLGLTADAEITLEANPEDLTAPQLRAFRAAGVNRISLGAQSLDDDLLRDLGRAHRGIDVERAVGAARLAGFDNLSIDLMHGWHTQSPEAAEADLARALALDPEHVSLYQLTIESQTRFGAEARRGAALLADEDDLLRMFLGLRAQLRAAGLEPYEISSAARPGRRAVHNSGYWTEAAYLGLGAGAHGFEPRGETARRWRNERHAQRYMEAALAHQPRAEEEHIDAETRRFERLMTGLRMDEGVRVDDRLAAFAPTAAALASEGLLQVGETRWAATDRGRVTLDTLLARFLDVVHDNS